MEKLQLFWETRWLETGENIFEKCFSNKSECNISTKLLVTTNKSVESHILNNLISYFLRRYSYVSLNKFILFPRFDQLLAGICSTTFSSVASVQFAMLAPNKPQGVVRFHGCNQNTCNASATASKTTDPSAGKFKQGLVKQLYQGKK